MKLKNVILCIIMLSGLLAKDSVIDKVHYTTVNQLGLTITNYGVLGEYYKNPDQPSCMYKQHTDNIKEQIEHMAHGGLWVGGKLNGELVRDILDKNQSAGYHDIHWNACDEAGISLNSGLYFYQIHAGDYLETHKMMLVK